MPIYTERKHAVFRRSVGGGGRREMESTQANSNASSVVDRLKATCVRIVSNSYSSAQYAS